MPGRWMFGPGYPQAGSSPSRFSTISYLPLADEGYVPVNFRESIDRWNPRLALLSVAVGDKLGRPDEETMEALEGYQLLRTDLDGWIEVSTDGERLWVEVEGK